MTSPAVPPTEDLPPDKARPDFASFSTSRLATVFGELFEEHAGVLHGYLARRIGVTVADDLVADTFLIAWRERNGYDPARAGVRAWLFGIATNLLHHHVRAEIRGLRATARMARQAHVGEEHADRVADRVDAELRVRQLSAALAKLSAGDRDVLLLVSWAGLSPVEAAQALDIPAGTARSRLHRVRRWLRAHAASIDTSGKDGDD